MSAPHTTVDHLVIPLRVEIRPCVESDLPNLEWYGAFHLQRELLHRAFERHVAGENLMLVAIARGYPVGQIWVDLEKKEPESVGILSALRVLPFMQGCGIGARLIGSAEHILLGNGYAAAEISAEKDNPRARRLYERMGYLLLGEEVHEFDYTTPEGAVTHARVDQWVLQKALVAVADGPSIPLALREPGFIGVDTAGEFD